MHDQLRNNKLSDLVTLYYEGRSLSEIAISELEKQIKDTPNNHSLRAKLLGAYLLPTELRIGPDPSKRYRPHLVWFVDNFPTAAIGPACTQALLPEEDQELFEELSLLWQQKMNEDPTDFNTAFNASIFFESAGSMKMSLEAALTAKKLIGKDYVTDKRIRFLKKLIRENPREGTWKRIVKGSEDFDSPGD